MFWMTSTGSMIVIDVLSIVTQSLPLLALVPASLPPGLAWRAMTRSKHTGEKRHAGKAVAPHRGTRSAAQRLTKNLRDTESAARNYAAVEPLEEAERVQLEAFTSSIVNRQEAVAKRARDVKAAADSRLEQSGAVFESAVRAARSAVPDYGPFVELLGKGPTEGFHLDSMGSRWPRGRPCPWILQDIQLWRWLECCKVQDGYLFDCYKSWISDTKYRWFVRFNLDVLLSFNQQSSNPTAASSSGPAPPTAPPDDVSSDEELVVSLVPAPGSGLLKQVKTDTVSPGDELEVGVVRAPTSVRLDGLCRWSISLVPHVVEMLILEAGRVHSSLTKGTVRALADVCFDGNLKAVQSLLVRAADSYIYSSGNWTRTLAAEDWVMQLPADVPPPYGGCFAAVSGDKIAASALPVAALGVLKTMSMVQPIRREGASLAVTLGHGDLDEFASLALKALDTVRASLRGAETDRRSRSKSANKIWPTSLPVAPAAVDDTTKP